MNHTTRSKILFFGFFLYSLSVNAQCAMCSATAESSIDSGSSAAKGLNAGVLYLLLMPLLFSSVFILIYLKRKRELEKHGLE